MKIIDSQHKDVNTELKRIINRGETATEEVSIAVREVVERVRKQGDPAVLEYTEKFDRATFTLKNIRVSQKEIKDAYAHVDAKKIEALKLAARNIRTFHEKQKLSSWVSQEADGVILGQLARPIRSAGIYVPGGKACYPSSVLMNAIPAKVAGVEQLVMCSPAPGGNLNPYILAAADVADLVAFLSWVRHIDTNGWPPQPLTRLAASANRPAAPGAYQAKGCSGCHMIDGQGASGPGPDRSHIGSVAYNGMPNDPAFLARWLADPPAVKPGTAMPKLPLSQAEIDSLVRYLAALK